MALPKILITIGDPAGIGPEVVDAALRSGKLPTGFDFQIVGDRGLGKAGNPDDGSSREALRSLESAARQLADDPQTVAVVTGPVSKAGLERVGFEFPGQTEFFAARSGTETVAMCLSGDHLTVGLATIHVALGSVVEELTTEKIVSSGDLLAKFVVRQGSGAKRIAVAALNPHAGEDGRFGGEERRVIMPAIIELNRRHPGVFSGPHVPDAIFRDAAEGRFDAVLAMYHDQGLIPLKLLDFDSAVNITLGLPKPRTSPDHGTAFSIAGKGLARPDSMIRAIQVAGNLSR